MIQAAAYQPLAGWRARSVRLMPHVQALHVVLRTCRPTVPGRISLVRAAGFYLAQDVRSDRDQPPTDRAAMDGYAVVAADLAKGPVQLTCIGEAAAGRLAAMRVRPGVCVAILTGSSVPPGADAVVPVEHTRLHGRQVDFLSPATRGDNIRQRGEEAKLGQLLLARGTFLGPMEIGVCASAGLARPLVYPQPAVAIVCTGSEVRAAGRRVRPHQLRDSNGPALAAALEQMGLKIAFRAIVPDEPAAILANLQRAMKAAPVVLATGGISVGAYDFVSGAIKAAGGKVRFHGVSMKPGQPQLYATASAGRHIFGLPGNPVSAMTGFFELVVPGLRALCGAPAQACSPAMRLTLARPVKSKGTRTYFALARIVEAGGGTAVEPIRSAGSADLIAACLADGVIVVPAGITKLSAGNRVEFHPWRTMF